MAFPSTCAILKEFRAEEYLGEGFPPIIRVCPTYSTPQWLRRDALGLLSAHLAAFFALTQRIGALSFSWGQGKQFVSRFELPFA